MEATRPPAAQAQVALGQSLGHLPSLWGSVPRDPAHFSLFGLPHPPRVEREVVSRSLSR